MLGNFFPKKRRNEQKIKIQIYRKRRETWLECILVNFLMSVFEQQQPNCYIYMKLYIELCIIGSLHKSARIHFILFYFYYFTNNFCTFFWKRRTKYESFSIFYIFKFRNHKIEFQIATHIFGYFIIWEKYYSMNSGIECFSKLKFPCLEKKIWYYVFRNVKINGWSKIHLIIPKANNLNFHIH